MKYYLRYILSSIMVEGDDIIKSFMEKFEEILKNIQNLSLLSMVFKGNVTEF